MPDDDGRPTPAELGSRILRFEDALNMVLGHAANLMVALGLPWEGDVATLCNFAGDAGETRKRWDGAGYRAHAALHRLKLLRVPRSLAEWCPRDGNVLWWNLDGGGVPWVGAGDDPGRPAGHVWWTPLPVVAKPTE